MDLFAPPSAEEIAQRVGLHDAALATAVAGVSGSSELDALDDMMSTLASTVSE